MPWSLSLLPQASLSVTIILTGYILQQRCAPFVAVSAISGKLGLTADNLSHQLDVINSQRKRGSPDLPSSSARSHDTRVRKSSRRAAGAVGDESSPGEGGHPGAVVEPVWTPGTASAVRSTGASSEVSDPAGSASSSQPWVASSSGAVAVTSRARRLVVPSPSTLLRRTTHRVVRGASTKLKKAVYIGIVDYNHLETAFLVASVTILILGMVFTSQGFTPGSTGYNLLTAAAVVIIVASTGAFLSLLTFEVFRSLKFSALNDAARQLEVQQVEDAFLHARRGGAAAAAAARRGRRKSSVAQGLDFVRRRLSRTGGGRGRKASQPQVDGGPVGDDGATAGARRKSSILGGLSAIARRRFTVTQSAMCAASVGGASARRPSGRGEEVVAAPTVPPVEPLAHALAAEPTTERARRVWKARSVAAFSGNNSNP